MEKSNKTKTTQEDSQKDSLNEASGLIYWDDYSFDNQSVTVDHLKVNFKISKSK
jgi:hypothetical protein